MKKLTKIELTLMIITVLLAIIATMLVMLVARQHTIPTAGDLADAKEANDPHQVREVYRRLPLTYVAGGAITVSGDVSIDGTVETTSQD